MFEFEVSIIDTFFFGNLEKSPDCCTLVINGTLILNVEFVEIPAARMPPLLTPATVGVVDNPRVSPLSLIEITLL